MVELVDEADGVAAQAGALAVGGLPGGWPSRWTLPVEGWSRRPGNVEEGGLAGAGGGDESDDLAGRKGEGRAVEDGDRGGGAGVVGLGDALEAEDFRHGLRRR